MPASGRRVVAAASVLVLLLAGCFGDRGSEEPPIGVGFGSPWDTRWPARGGLADDARVVAEVAEVLADWRAPSGEEVDVAASTIVWLGELDGVVLGVVSAAAGPQPGGWLLELTGAVGDLAVTQAHMRNRRDITADRILPIRSTTVGGPRYLVASTVEAVSHGEQGLQVWEGITEPVEVPDCEISGVTIRVDGEEYWSADLGVEMAPAYPLVSGGIEGVVFTGTSSAAHMEGLDACTGVASHGWLRQRDAEEGEAAQTQDGKPLLVTTGAHLVDDVDFAGAQGALSVVRLGYDLGRGVGTYEEERVAWRPDDGEPVVAGPAETERPDLANVYIFPSASPDTDLAVLTFRRLRDPRAPDAEVLYDLGGRMVLAGQLPFDLHYGDEGTLTLPAP